MIAISPGKQSSAANTALTTLLFASMTLAVGCGFFVDPKIQPSQQPKAPQAPQMTSLSLNPTTVTIPLGESIQFIATATFSDGTIRDVTGDVTWQAVPSGVAKLDRSGIFTSVAVGSMTLTASLKSLAAKSTLTVSPASLVSIAVTTNSASVAKGLSLQLTATGTYTDDSQHDITGSVAWSVSPQAAGAISAPGVFTALSSGSVSVTASSGRISGSAAFSVTPAALVSVAVTSSQTSILLGDHEQFSAVGTFTDGTTAKIDAVWTSSSTAVVLIDGTGLATGAGVGNATIQASSGQLRGSVAINVTAPPPAPTPFAVTERASQAAPLGTAELAALQAQCAFIETLGSGQGICSCGKAPDKAATSTRSGPAVPNANPMLLVDYFSQANSDIPYDATLRVTNPGSTGSNVCAEIYVFAPDQQMTECCGCLITPDGLLTLSISDLTSNPLTGVKLTDGLIKLVPGDPSINSCDPSSITPFGEIRSWATHVDRVD